jgi:hypothetical protein
LNLRPLRPELPAVATILVSEHARTVPKPAGWWVAVVALRYFVAVWLRPHPLMQTQAPHAANRSLGRRTMSALAPGASPLGQTASRRAPPASSAISVLFTPTRGRYLMVPTVAMRELKAAKQPVGSGQRDTFCTGDSAFQPVDRGVDGVLGHHPIGRVLTARDDCQHRARPHSLTSADPAAVCWPCPSR